MLRTLTRLTAFILILTLCLITVAHGVGVVLPNDGVLAMTGYQGDVVLLDVRRDFRHRVSPLYSEQLAWSDDGSQLAFISGPGIFVANFDAGTFEIVSREYVLPSPLIFSPDGHYLATQTFEEGELYLKVIDFDTHTAQAIAEIELRAVPQWSPDSRTVLFTSNAGGELEVMVASMPGGDLTNLSKHPNYDFNGRWSPDGETIAFVSARDTPSLRTFLYDVPTGTLSPLTGSRATAPLWSPDGRYLVQSVPHRDTPRHIDTLVIEVDSGETTLFSEPETNTELPLWPADGSRLLLSRFRAGGVRDLLVFDPASDAVQVIEDVAQSNHSIFGWTRDNDRIVYTTQLDVFTLDVDTAEAHHRADVRGFTNFQWRP